MKFLFCLLLTPSLTAWAAPTPQEVLQNLRQTNEDVRQNVYQLPDTALAQINTLLNRISTIAMQGQIPPNPDYGSVERYLRMADAELFATAIGGIGKCSIADKRNTSAAYSYYVLINSQGYALSGILSDFGGTNQVSTATSELRKLLKDGVCIGSAIPVDQMYDSSIFALAASRGIGKCSIKDQRNTSAAYYYYLMINGVGARFDSRLSDYGGVNSIEVAGNVMRSLVKNGSCY